MRLTVRLRRRGGPQPTTSPVSTRIGRASETKGSEVRECVEGEWESDDLVVSLREMYSDWIRRDVTRLHLEGGIWGVGLVISYWDRSEYRELLESVVEENELQEFAVEAGPDWNAKLFLALEPDTLAWYFTEHLLTVEACYEIKQRLGQTPGIRC
jgi:hypothetical protein